MIGQRSCRSCQGTMAVAGSTGHWRCPHCRCWMPTGESWTPVIYALAILGLGAAIFGPKLLG